MLSGHKNNEVHAKAGMNLGHIMLRERNQMQRAIYHMTPFTGNVQNGQTCRDLWLPGAGGVERMMSLCIPASV